jgi:SAM-dependent methyltransferase
VTEVDTSPNRHYGVSYYRHYWGGGEPYERNERWMRFFDRVADGIVRNLRPASVLDVGCAMGMLVEALSNRGVDAWGIDVSEHAIAAVADSIGDRCSVASVVDPLPRRYDLITCIEVLEHVPPSQADIAIANLCQATDRILLSSTPRDYGEPTHLNVQQPEVWAAALAREGFLRDLDHDGSYLSPWAALYVRTEESLAETVRRYERSWWHLRWEATETREALLSLQARLEQFESEADASKGKLEEATRQDQEVLRLRDLLIGQEAELGLARGRLAELEDQSARLTNALDQLRSRMPGIIWLGIGSLRKLRGG